MNNILHKVNINTDAESLYHALTQAEHLSQWWSHSQSCEQEGGLLQVFFGPNRDHQVDFRIKQMIPNKKVVWQCEQGPWENTGEFVMEVFPNEQGCDLFFSHYNWPDADAFFRHCNSKWGYFLTISLKPYLESGEGVPNPHDSNI